MSCIKYWMMLAKLIVIVDKSVCYKLAPLIGSCVFLRAMESETIS